MILGDKMVQVPGTTYFPYISQKYHKTPKFMNAPQNLRVTYKTKVVHHCNNTLSEAFNGTNGKRSIHALDVSKCSSFNILVFRAHTVHQKELCRAEENDKATTTISI